MKFFATLLLCLSTSSALAQFGYLDATSSIQTQLNGKQGTLTLTTTGTSGAATLVGNTLNIPAYSGSIGGLTAGYIPQATSATAIGNSFIDYGVTTAGVYTSTKEIDGTIFKWNGGGTIGGGQDWVEGTAPTGVAGDDLVYALASNHRIQMKLNAGSALNIPGIATAGTSGNCVKLAANGIDLVDNGSACASSSFPAGAVGSYIRYSAANTAGISTTVTEATTGTVLLQNATNTYLHTVDGASQSTDSVRFESGGFNQAFLLNGGNLLLGAKSNRLQYPIQEQATSTALTAGTTSVSYPSGSPVLIFTGTAATALATLSAPADCTFGGYACVVRLLFETTGNTVTTTGGNFFSAYTFNAGRAYTCVYDNSIVAAGKWLCGN